MFNNRKDPLIDSVKKVMAENETRRQAEFDLNEELGIASKRALPHEHHANYDALLEQRITEALKGNQHKIDANQNGRVDDQDFKILKAKKQVQEADDETHEISFADKPGQKFKAMGKDPTKMSDADAKAQMDKQDALPGPRDNKGLTPSDGKSQKSDDTSSPKKASPDTPEGREGYSSDWKNAPKRPAPHSPEDDEDNANMLKAAETQYQRNREAIKSGRPNDVKTDLGTDANGNKKYFSPIYPTKPDGTSAGPGTRSRSTKPSPEDAKMFKEAIGDKEGTAGTLRKNGKPFVPDTLANSPFMQASPDKAPMPPERPKDLDKQAPTPPARPKDLNEISRNLARMVIRKAAAERDMGSKKDRSKAVELAGKKAYSIPSEPKIRATNEESLNENLKSHFKSWTSSEDAPRDDQSGDDNAVHRKAMSYLRGTKVPKENHDDMAEKLTNMFHGMKESINENHVLYTHPKADIKVVRKGKGSKEGAAIEVHKGGKKVASGDYDHGADAFFVNVGGKGQKSFDSAKDIANHFHGMSEQFQQIDEMAPKGAKYERMVKHIKDKYSKDGKLSDKEKSIAYATAWKAKNKNMKEGLTAEQVMAEIRKNLGEAKMKKIEELYGDPNKSTEQVRAAIQTGIDNKDVATKTVVPGKTPEDPYSMGGSQATTNKPATPVEPKPTTPNVIKNQDTGAPGQDPGDRVSSAPSKLPTFASGAPGTPKITPTPNVDKNVPTGGAPAAGAAALTKQTPRPATPSAAKPTAPKPTTPTAKDDIWNDSMIRRTGEGGMETADDFNRNQDLYKQRMAAGGQKPAPSSAPSSPAKPTAPKPTTPTAPTGSSTMRDAAMSDRGGGGTSSTSQNGGSAMPSGAGGNAALRAAKRDGDGTTSDTFNRFQSNKPGTTSDTFNRLQSNKPGGTYTRASQTPSNEVGSPANDTVGTSPNQNRTPAKDMLARKTKPTSALNTRNNTSVAESFTDTIMKVLKG